MNNEMNQLLKHLAAIDDALVKELDESDKYMSGSPDHMHHMENARILGRDRSDMYRRIGELYAYSARQPKWYVEYPSRALLFGVEMVLVVIEGVLDAAEFCTRPLRKN